MPQPTSSLATLRPDLGQGIEAFDLAADRAGFIGLRVLPVLEVAVSAGSYGQIPMAQLLQNRETARAARTGYSRGDWTFEPKTFATSEHGAEEVIDDKERAMYRNYFDAEMIAAMRARDIVLRNYEKRVAGKVMDTSVWTGASKTTAVSKKWSSHADATPITDVEAAKIIFWENCGLWPNALILNRLVYNDIRQCAQILDRITSAGAGDSILPGRITENQIAQAFDLPFVLVAGGAQNTAKEGQAVSIDSIWPSNRAQLARIATSGDVREPALGRTFHWGEDGSQIGGAFETYRDEAVRGDVVRARMDTEEKIMFTELGHLLTNIR